MIDEHEILWPLRAFSYKTVLKQLVDVLKIPDRKWYFRSFPSTSKLP